MLEVGLFIVIACVRWFCLIIQRKRWKATLCNDTRSKFLYVSSVVAASVLLFKEDGNLL